MSSLLVHLDSKSFRCALFAALKPKAIKKKLFSACSFIMSYILEMTKYKGPFFFVIVCAILLEGHFTVSLFVLKYLIVYYFVLPSLHVS